MIYCSLDPGLLTLEGLQPHQLGEARLIVDALSVHSQNIYACHGEIPVTAEYFQHILESITCAPIQTPPVAQPFKELIFALLSHVITPPLASGSSDGIIIPDIVSAHVNEQTRNLWLNSLTAALFQKITDVGSERAKVETLILGRTQPERHCFVNVKSESLGELLNSDNTWKLPILVTAIDWAGFHCEMNGWPLGLDNHLLELFAYHELDIKVDIIQNRRQVRFEPGCFREISREENQDYRKAIIEVIACRAYNLIRPEHDDHENKKFPGTRRVYVKKMTPPIRLHYYFDGDDIIYCLYSNNDHDRGLR